MRIEEIYQLEQCHRSHSLQEMCSGMKSHLVGVDPWDMRGLESERVEVRVVEYEHIDCRRYWQLATVWFDGKPVMVVQHAGREGDDHAERFVTDLDGYKALVLHVKNLVASRELEDFECTVFPVEYDDESLTNFYGHRLCPR